MWGLGEDKRDWGHLKSNKTVSLSDCLPAGRPWWDEAEWEDGSFKVIIKIRTSKATGSFIGSGIGYVIIGRVRLDGELLFFFLLTRH